MTVFSCGTSFTSIFFFQTHLLHLRQCSRYRPVPGYRHIPDGKSAPLFIINFLYYRIFYIFYSIFSEFIKNHVNKCLKRALHATFVCTGLSEEHSGQSYCKSSIYLNKHLWQAKSPNESRSRCENQTSPE